MHACVSSVGCFVITDPLLIIALQVKNLYTGEIMYTSIDNSSLMRLLNCPLEPKHMHYLHGIFCLVVILDLTCNLCKIKFRVLGCNPQKLNLGFCNFKA